MSRTSWLALLLAASHLLTVIVTCPTAQRTPLDAALSPPVGPVSHSLPDQGASEIHAQHHDHQAGGEEAPPCHGPTSALKAPCPCGCDGGAPVARSGLFGVGEMILVEASDLCNEGLPAQSASGELPLPIANPSDIDHVPIFA
jgi:hypothetical protein